MKSVISLALKNLLSAGSTASPTCTAEYVAHGHPQAPAKLLIWLDLASSQTVLQTAGCAASARRAMPPR
jgi:hypothetical protein